MSTKEFISAIKSRRILWDYRHPSYKNQHKRRKTWKEIENEFNLSSYQCKRKWHTLRNTLYSQNQKEINKGSQVAMHWAYSEDMDFLRPIIRKKSMLCVGNVDVDKSSESSIETDWEATPLDPIQAAPEKQKKPKSKVNLVLKLIEAVKQKEILWNPNDSSFNNVELNDKAWQEIGLMLGLQSDNCKTKWKSLKVNLALECAKHPDNKSSWVYFKNLDFIRPFVEKGERKSTVHKNDSYEDPSGTVLENNNIYTEQVIAAVQRNPILWNLNHNNYKSVFKKQQVWKKIAHSLDTSVEECKKKWRGLRDIFVRSYTKNSDSKTNSWPLFEKMKFLCPHLQGKRFNFARTFDEIEESDEDSLSPVCWDLDNIQQNTKPKTEKVKKFTSEEFIEEIKKARILWDSTFYNYKNMKLRCVAWKEIADCFGLSVPDCKKKYKVLRDMFARNYTKPIDEQDKCWKYYKKMLFLGPHLREKRGGRFLEGSFEEFKCETKEYTIASESEGSQNDETKIYEARISTKLNGKEFINVVKENKILWDLSHENYKRKDLRQEAWEEIATHFALSIDDCKKRWRTLRDAFARNYFKPIKEEYKTYKYYKELKFLLPNLRNKKGINILDEDSDAKNKEDKDASFSSLCEETQNDDKEPSGLWTVEKYAVEEFIDVVKQHPILWDSSNDNYKNNQFRLLEWEKVAAHFASSVEECKRKWKALRDSFVRNYCKPVKEKYIAWAYYNQMMFLGPHIQYRKSDPTREENDESSASAFEDDETQIPQQNRLQKFSVKEFICEIRKQRILWDLNHEHCKIKKYRLKAWREIGAHFHLSSTDCRKKWTALRRAFTREFAKHPDGAVWEKFKELDFILPYLKANITSIDAVVSETDLSFEYGPLPPKDNIEQPEYNDTSITKPNEPDSDTKNKYETSPHSDNSDSDSIEKFILAVKQQKMLWDPTDCNYIKTLQRQQAWNNIAKEFEISINDAKKKWNNLRDSFVVDLYKNAKVKRKSDWKYYKYMVFLRPHLRLNKLEATSSEDNTDIDSSRKNKVKPKNDETTMDVEFTSEFIETVREKNLLWNWNDVNYMNAVKSEEAWREIAEKFFLTSASCQRRWKALEQTFTQIVLTNANDKKSSWDYFEEMTFLRPFIKDTTNFVEVSGGLTFYDIIEEVDNFTEQFMDSKGNNKVDALFEELVECSSSLCGQKVEDEKNQNSTRAAKRKKYSCSSTDDEDEDFHQNLKHKMKKLPSKAKRDAKAHIEAYLNVITANYN